MDRFTFDGAASGQVQSSEDSLSVSAAEPAGRSSTDRAARIAGAILVVTAVATVIAVGARVTAGADQPTLVESLAAISANKVPYSIGGAARLVSGLTLVAAAWFTSRAMSLRQHWAGRLLPALLALSGAFTAASGLCAVTVAASVPDLVEDVTANASVEAWAYARWLTGKIGFTAAGLALIATAGSQCNSGGTLRYFSLLSGIIGVAMLFIWLDAATVVHRITGIAFLVWLLVIGGMLVSGWLDRNLTRIVQRSSTGSIDG